MRERNEEDALGECLSMAIELWSPYPYFGPSRSLPRVLRGPTFPYFCVLSSIEIFDTRIDRQKFDTQINRENCLFWMFSQLIRVSTATYTRIMQRLSPTYLFCTISFTCRNFESNGTRIDQKWSIPLDSSTVSPQIRVPLSDSIVFTSSLLFFAIFSQFFRSHTTALRLRAKTAKNVPSFAFEWRKHLPSQPKRLIQVNLDSKRSYIQYN